MITIRNLAPGDIDGVVQLQRKCFPPPFPEDLLWANDHLIRHLQVFPDGQFVALDHERVVASASATRIDHALWESNLNWTDTVGGPMLETFDGHGDTMYGLDISVHPDYRGKGIARTLYGARQDFVRRHGLKRFGTACRLPGYVLFRANHPAAQVQDYVCAVLAGRESDRTLTPLTRLGLRYVDVVHEYMDDPESGNAAALLEWQP